MKNKSLRLISLFVLLTAASLTAFAESKSKTELARQAVSLNPAESAEAVKNLRTMGRDGLEALFETYAQEIEKFRATGEATEEWKRIAAALDTVAAQKDAYAARLFWHTDLEEAKKAADASNKPILSLRLLGNLTEEFSCANSRLFRAVLYPNAEISKYLGENYVLHWQSVRPVPRVTIDFGDGRKIERTLTGNSIHYILDEEGEIIDALPGLYSPKSFLKYLTQGRQVNKIIDGLPQAQKEVSLLRYRRTAFNEILTKRGKILEMAKVKLTEPAEGLTAIEVAPRAIAKMAVTDEISILRGIADDFSRNEPQINLDDWKKLAKFYSPSQKLDDVTTAFVRRQTARTGLTEAEFASLLAKLENFIALDTTRNDFLFHMKLYGWLNRNRQGETLEQFNSRVYADIFKTPETDKWLGLYSADVYTALDGNGIIK
jgi:hypothetical protein